ncbi:uncharacterized protein [Typha latifolia]|uniref:uncharacterized protein isoform X4 n=1 Tax=Typha latifolia TaxID=4733 RepID=UPI003C2BECE5
MADTKPSLSPVGASPSLPPKVYFGPMGQRIEGLDKSQSELLARLQGLKLELQNWRLNLDTQFKTYKDELLELKKALNSEVNQLRSEFKELRTTLQEQQDNVTIDHKNMVIIDEPKYTRESGHHRAKTSQDEAEAGEEALSSDNKGV